MVDSKEKYVVTSFMENYIPTEQAKNELLAKLNSGLQSVKNGLNVIRQAIIDDKNADFKENFLVISKGLNAFYYNEDLLSHGYKNTSVQYLIGGSCDNITSTKVKNAWVTYFKEVIKYNNLQIPSSGSAFDIALAILPYLGVASFTSEVFADNTIYDWYDSKTNLDDFYAAKAVCDYFYRFLFNKENVTETEVIDYLGKIRSNRNLDNVPTNFGFAYRRRGAVGCNHYFAYEYNKGCNW